MRIRGFLFVSLLLLGRPTLRTNLSLVRPTSKCRIASSFHRKYSSVHVKVKDDQCVCPHLPSTQQMMTCEHVTRDR